MPQVRQVRPDDLDALLGMNNAAAPAVNALDADALAQLVDDSLWTGVVDGVDGPAGFLLGLHGPGLGYPSENYAWFSERFERFIYVDRVVVAESARGTGLGSLLYDAFASHGDVEGHPVLCAEVNVRPHNPGSLRFHEAQGFVTLGEQETKGGSVRVRMLAKALGPRGHGPIAALASPA